MSIRDIIIILLVFGLLPWALMRPYIGVLVWSWLGYMSPHRLTWGMAYNFPFVQIVAIVTLIGMIFVSREKKEFPVSGITIVWLMFIIWMCLSTLFAYDTSSAVTNLVKIMKIQLMVLVTLLLFNSKDRIDKLVWVIVFSIGFYGFKGGIFTLISGGQFRVWGPTGSFIEGNNELALALLIIIPLIWYLQLNAQNKWIKRFLLLSALLCAISVIGSYSRGALLGALAMGFALWLKSHRKLVTAVPIVLVGLIALAFMPDKWMERMNTIQTYEQDGSAMSRINAWKFAINLANDNPILGGGFGAFNRELFKQYAPQPEIFQDAHSIYFSVLGEHGYIGLLLFLGMGLLGLTTANKVIKIAKTLPDYKWAGDLAAMAQVSIIGYAVCGAFLRLSYFDLPYHVVAIIAILYSLVKKEQVKVQPKEGWRYQQIDTRNRDFT